MPNPIDNLIAGFQGLVEQVPDLLQPLIVAGAGAVPFIEGEGAAVIGVIGGLHPLVAGLAAAAGNFTCVLLVVLLSSRIRTAARARRARPAVAVGDRVGALGSEFATTRTLAPEATETTKPESKGRKKLRGWLVRFGVPGASVLGPLAIPTQFTAAFFVASGISKGRVLLWQAIAITLWTGLITAVAMGFLVAVEL